MKTNRPGRVAAALNIPLAALMGVTCLFADPAAAGRTLLEVTGPDGQTESFDLERLEALEQIEFTTETLWTDDATMFSGPALLDVVAEAGIEDGEIDMTALNHYTVTMDLSDEMITESHPIIATRRDGEPYRIRDNGPLWVMFPFDDNSDLQQENYYSYSIWQLVRIEVSEAE